MGMTKVNDGKSTLETGETIKGFKAGNCLSNITSTWQSRQRLK